MPPFPVLRGGDQQGGDPRGISERIYQVVNMSFTLGPWGGHWTTRRTRLDYGGSAKGMAHSGGSTGASRCDGRPEWEGWTPERLG